MPTVSKVVVLLAAVAGTCSAAPTDRTPRAPRALKAREESKSFLLTPVANPASLAESGQNASNWYPNQTYLDIHGNLTLSKSEAVRFTFVGADNSKLELVAQANRTLAIGVDASLFDHQDSQPFRPLVYSDPQLNARDTSLAERKCNKTCNGTPGSKECLRRIDDLQVTQGFSFAAAYPLDLDILKPRDLVECTNECVRTNPPTRIEACFNERCPGWNAVVLSAREKNRDNDPVSSAYNGDTSMKILDPRNGLKDCTDECVRTNNPTQIEACFNERCPGWRGGVLSARKDPKDAFNSSQCLQSMAEWGCEKPCNGFCDTSETSERLRKGPPYPVCWCRNLPSSIRRDTEDSLTQTDRILLSTLEAMALSLEDVADDIGDDDDTEDGDDLDDDLDDLLYSDHGTGSTFNPLLSLEWSNEKFKVRENGTVTSAVAGFCVVGLGQPGSQVGVLSPVSGSELEMNCVKVTLHPTFVDMLDEDE